KLGLRPTSPHQAAGIRTEPPMSLPSASGTQPDATAAPDPPDEPPGVRSGFQGFRVTPQRGLSVKLEYANSGVVVFPTMIAPAPCRRSTSKALSSGTQCSKAYEPRVVRLPFVGVRSLIATGTPCNGPTGTPAVSVSSASRASRIASSGQ